MATVGITRGRTPTGNAPAASSSGQHPKAVLQAERGTKLILPFAPRGTDLGGLADVWERVPRPGRKDLNLRTARRLPTMGMTLVLARPDHQQSIEDLLAALSAIGEAEERVVFENMSPQERGPWRITDLAISGTARQYGTNHITRATAALTLTAASDPLSRRGPLSGGKDGGGKGDVRRYTVKEGDTLRKLADRFYGSPGKWQPIAKANGIKRKPGEPLKPGTVLRIPDKGGT